jgi:hypothetical protein
MHAVIEIIFYIDHINEVSMINKKIIIFASTQVQKMAKFERKQQTICILADGKLCGSQQ